MEAIPTVCFSAGTCWALESALKLRNLQMHKIQRCIVGFDGKPLRAISEIQREIARRC
jgi:hypothetical protein